MRSNVTIRQLEAFVAVAELGRFNLAAGRLNLTQSAISVLVKELETGLKQRLFDRHTRMVSLTDAGREFFPQARKVLDDLDLAIENIHELEQLERGRVTIASAIVLAATVLPAIIARFKEKHPHIILQLVDMPEDEMRGSLKRNEIDLAVGTVSYDDPEIATTPLFNDQLMLICSSKHPLSGRRSVSWAEVVNEPLIALSKENPLRGLVDQILLAQALTSRPSFEVRFSTTAVSMVAAGLGVSILPSNTIQLAPKVDVVAVELIEPTVARCVSIIQHRQRAQSTAAATMKMFIMENVQPETGRYVAEIRPNPA